MFARNHGSALRLPSGARRGASFRSFGGYCERLTRPIRLMERTMKAVEKGDFDVELQVQGPLEVERLASRFNLMVHKIRQLMP